MERGVNSVCPTEVTGQRRRSILSGGNSGDLAVKVPGDSEGFVVLAAEMNPCNSFGTFRK
jgi:hypothetical protein